MMQENAITCLECKRLFNNNLGLSAHLRRTHQIKFQDYIQQYDIADSNRMNCNYCHKLIRSNKNGICQDCRMKYHNPVIFVTKEGRRRGDKIRGEKLAKNWENDEYRESHKQTLFTRTERSKSLKLFHIENPESSRSNTLAMRTISMNRNGKTNIMIYGEEKANMIRDKSSKSHIGKISSIATNLKIGAGNKNKIVSTASRKKTSTTRIRKILSGEIKISPNAGFGKGGYKEDIGHYVRSSYEHNFAKFLRQNNIQYQYEPRVFKVIIHGVQGSYRPDFWISNIWIEIKNSYNVQDIQFNQKLNAFKEQYPQEIIYVIVGNEKEINTWKIVDSQADLVDILVKLEPLAVVKG